MKELAKRVEEKLKKFERITEVKYFNRLEIFHKQAEKEVREEIELGIINRDNVPYGDENFEKTIKITAEQRTEIFFAYCYTDYERRTLKEIIKDLEENIRIENTPMFEMLFDEKTSPSDINTCVSELEKVSNYPFRAVLIDYFGLNQHLVDKLMDRPVLERGKEITYL